MFEREPITAGELMDKQFLPKPVIVEGMLPAGTYILAGTPKIGKSFLMTQLCWSVAEGIPFLGLATRKSTVLYLALEDTQERLQSRLARLVRLRISSAVSDQSARRRLDTAVSGFYSRTPGHEADRDRHTSAGPGERWIVIQLQP